MLLLPQEMAMAGHIGLLRQIESIMSGRTPQFPEQYPNQMFSTHVVGAMAELHVAKFLGVNWDGHINHFSKPDLLLEKGDSRVWVEVRYTPKRSDIKVKNTDPDHAIVIGVTGMPPHFEIMGYVRAGKVKAEYQQSAPAEGRPAWFANNYTEIGKLVKWIESP